MKVVSTKGFEKAYLLVPSNIKHKASLFYNSLLTANSIRDLTGIKKLTGHTNFYRYKIGDYRLGFELQGDVVTLLIILHRKDIYRQFP